MLALAAWSLAASAQSSDVPPAPAAASAPAAAASVPDRTKLPISYQADSVQGRPDQETVLEGHVKLRQDGMSLGADRVEYNAPDDLARATGRVRIVRDGNVYAGSELSIKLPQFEGYFLKPSYYFGLTQTGGRADRIDFADPRHITASGATYTSCPASDDGTPDWVLSTGSIKLDFDTGEGVAEHAVLRFLGVPILALPSMSFPLTDERKSGWLPPDINLSNTNGFELGVPYYWNIAPNYDATLTPLLMTRRGFGVDGEFRYLEPNWRGTLVVDTLPADQVARRNRWALRSIQLGELPNNAYYSWRVQRTSDDGYWKDFPGKLESITPRMLASNGQLQRDWLGEDLVTSAYARVEAWQVLQDPSNPIVPPYQREPQIGVRQRGAKAGWQWSWETEINRFTLEDSTLTGSSAPNGLPNGTRVHALGALSRPLAMGGWTLTPKVSLNAASYDLSQPMANGQTRASRLIPSFSLDSAWVFERATTLFGKDTTQTLEPRLFYVNTPYRAQSFLPTFDSAAKDLNFTSVYTENAFSGVDRVSDANQITAGVATRYLDTATGAEVLRLGAAQRYLLRDQLITPDDGPPVTTRLSDLLLLASTTLVPKWKLDSSLQYSYDQHKLERSTTSVRYSPGPFRTVSATYRLTRGLTEQVELGWQWPISGLTPLEKPVTKPEPDAMPASMLGAAFSGSSGKCKGSWYTVGRISYSLLDRRITDSIVGLEYDAGCWIGRIVAERLSTGTSESTTRLMLQLELVGFSRLGSNPLKTLKDNIPGYRLLRDDALPGTPSGTSTATYE
ncbi:MAG TPA: LPS assembly protein LptD [Methylibium sp.]